LNEALLLAGAKANFVYPKVQYLSYY